MSVHIRILFTAMLVVLAGVASSAQEEMAEWDTTAQRGKCAVHAQCAGYPENAYCHSSGTTQPTCQAKRNIGEYCAYDRHCKSNYCVNLFCESKEGCEDVRLKSAEQNGDTAVQVFRAMMPVIPIFVAFVDVVTQEIVGDYRRDVKIDTDIRLWNNLRVTKRCP